MGPGQPKPARKRNRKRKRRVVSDSSSSEEDSSSSSSDAESTGPKKTVTVRQLAKPAAPESTDEESEDDLSSSSDESQDDSDPGVEGVDMSLPSSRPGRPGPPLQRDSPSPQPTVEIPPFILPNAPESEQALKEKFRKFWMASIAEGFKDDLEEIRKVCDPREGHCSSAACAKHVRRWIGTESCPVTAGAPHRVACFWCRCILFELCWWLCERDGSCVGSASIALFFDRIPSTWNFYLRY